MLFVQIYYDFEPDRDTQNEQRSVLFSNGEKRQGELHFPHSLFNTLNPSLQTFSKVPDSDIDRFGFFQCMN